MTVAELGLITPPVGMNLFVIQGVASDLRIQTIVKGVVPFLAADVVRLGHGTTVGTNTLIQRRGASVALITTSNSRSP